MRCSKCNRAYARPLLNSVMCVEEACSNYNEGWREEVMQNILPQEVWGMRHQYGGYPHWYPEEFRFLADPMKYPVDGEDWVWTVNTGLTTMYGVKVSCPISPSVPRFFREKLGKRAVDSVTTLKNGFDAGPVRRHGISITHTYPYDPTMSKWSKYLYDDLWGPERRNSALCFTRVLEGDKIAFFNTGNLLQLLGGEPEGSGIFYSGISPTKVSLTSDAKFCAARPGMAAITSGYLELDSSYDRYVNTEIVLDD